MTATAMLIKEIKTLPEESVKEALDFVLFLRNKARGDVRTRSERKEERFSGMNRPVHLGFDLRNISREELYDR